MIRIAESYSCFDSINLKYPGFYCLYSGLFHVFNTVNLLDCLNRNKFGWLTKSGYIDHQELNDIHRSVDKPHLPTQPILFKRIVADNNKFLHIQFTFPAIEKYN